MFSHICKLFSAIPDKPKLGRWNLKTCKDLSASINSIYQNRDHCSDKVCTEPQKFEEYIDKDKKNE